MNRKFISMLCAASMAAGSMAGLAVTASADGAAVLYSNNFNGYPADRVLAIAYSTQSGWQGAADGGNEFFQNVLKWNTPTSYKMIQDAGSFSKEELAEKSGITIDSGSSNDDDTQASIVRAEEGGNQYLTIPKGRFSNKSGVKGLVGFDTLSANDGEELVVSFKAKMTRSSQSDDESVAEDPEIKIGNITTVTLDGLSEYRIDGTDWFEIKVVIDADNNGAYYFNGTEVASGIANASLADGISTSKYAAGTKRTTYASMAVDDLVVLSAPSGTGATVEIPAAETVTDSATFETVATPAPEPDAPVLTAPDGVDVAYANNFDVAENGTWAMGTEAQTVTDVAGMTINLGGRSSGGATDTYANIAGYGNGKIMNLVGGKFATAGRGPVVSFNDALELEDGVNSVLTFAVKLSNAVKEGSTPRLYMLKDTAQAGSDGSGAYRNVAAVLTTVEGEVLYRSDENSEVISAYVEPDTWHYVTFVVSADKYRVFLDDNTEAVISSEYVASGDNASKMTALPLLAIESQAGNGSASYGKASIDSIITYTSSDEPKNLIPSTDGEGTTPKPSEPSESGDPTDPTEPTETATPAPTATPKPAKKAAPVLNSHASAENEYTQDFSAAAVGEGITQSTEAQDPYTGIEGLVLSVGTKGTEGSDVTGVKVTENILGDNVLTLTSGKFASSGRNAKIALADDLSIADDESLTSIMAFAFKVSKSAAGEDDRAVMYLLDNATNVDSNGNARDVLAVFTAEGDSENYSNGDTSIGIDVTADEWHVATVAVSTGKYRVYLDGEYENPIVQGTKVGVGATSVPVTHLPMITGSNSKTLNHSVVTVDNILAYQISGIFDKKYLPTITEAEVWTKYAATYAENGQLVSVVSEAVADPSAVDTTGNTAAAKTFVWNSGLQPYAPAEQ